MKKTTRMAEEGPLYIKVNDDQAYYEELKLFQTNDYHSVCFLMDMMSEIAAKEVEK